MIIIRNRLVPFPKFAAINIFGVLFCRREIKITEGLINHERIHTAQIIEMGFVFFYLWYVTEWVIRLFMEGNAYKNISLEREAYRHDHDLSYLNRRKHYAWTKLLKDKDKNKYRNAKRRK